MVGVALAAAAGEVLDGAQQRRLLAPRPARGTRRIAPRPAAERRLLGGAGEAADRRAFADAAGVEADDVEAGGHRRRQRGVHAWQESGARSCPGPPGLRKREPIRPAGSVAGTPGDGQGDRRALRLAVAQRDHELGALPGGKLGGRAGPPGKLVGDPTGRGERPAAGSRTASTAWRCGSAAGVSGGKGRTGAEFATRRSPAGSRARSRDSPARGAVQEYRTEPDNHLSSGHLLAGGLAVGTMLLP